MSVSGKRKVVGLFIAAAAMCAIGGGSSVANARGQSVATNCVKIGSGGIISYGGDGSVTNLSSTENLQVSCPVDWAGGDTKMSGLIEYIDSSATFAVTCTIRAEAAFGGTAMTATSSSPAGTNDNVYRGMNTQQTSGIADGGLHVTCIIPRVDPQGELSFLVSHNMT